MRLAAHRINKLRVDADRFVPCGHQFTSGLNHHDGVVIPEACIAAVLPASTICAHHDVGGFADATPLITDDRQIMQGLEMIRNGFQDIAIGTVRHDQVAPDGDTGRRWASSRGTSADIGIKQLSEQADTQRKHRAQEDG